MAAKEPEAAREMVGMEVEAEKDGVLGPYEVKCGVVEVRKPARLRDEISVWEKADVCRDEEEVRAWR